MTFLYQSSYFFLQKNFSLDLLCQQILKTFFLTKKKQNQICSSTYTRKLMHFVFYYQPRLERMSETKLFNPGSGLVLHYMYFIQNIIYTCCLLKYLPKVIFDDHHHLVLKYLQ